MSSLLADTGMSSSVRQLLEMDPTLPCQLVHKRAVEEVFFTDFEMRGDGGEFVVTAQLPRSHALYSELQNGVHDLLLIIEIGRQGMTAYGHSILGVPEGTAFVLVSSIAEVIDLDAIRRGHEPSTLVLPVPFVEGRRSARGRVRKYSLSSTGTIDGIPAVALTGEALLIPESLYERARGGAEPVLSVNPARPIAVAPSRVGRLAVANVVVGDARFADGELHCSVVVDSTHPTFFDHPLDHVPAMLMLEAARQAAMLFAEHACEWLPHEIALDRCDARFTRYAALQPPVRCRALELDRAGAPDACASAPAGGAGAPRQATEGDGATTVPARELRVHFAQAGQDNGFVDLRLRRMRR